MDYKVVLYLDHDNEAVSIKTHAHDDNASILEDRGYVKTVLAYGLDSQDAQTLIETLRAAYRRIGWLYVSYATLLETGPTEDHL